MTQIPLIFGSRKATVAAVGASLITFVMTVLPVLFPEVDPSVWSELSKLLTQVISLYLVSQGAVDVAGNWHSTPANEIDPNTIQIDIAPEA